MIPDATELGKIGGFRIYTVDGLPGLYRCTRREGTGLQPTVKGGVVAIKPGAKNAIELVRATHTEATLRKALAQPEAAGG
jgi:hypothetical protein